jgi:hypothetical protein
MFRSLSTIAGTAVLRKPWPDSLGQTMLENSAFSGAPGRLGLLCVDAPRYAARRVTDIEKTFEGQVLFFQVLVFNVLA